MPRPITVGVVGMGYWGPNLARNFAAMPESELRWICDSRSALTRRVAAGLPQAKVSDSLDILLEDPKLDAICLATNVSSHAELACAVLDSGKHCFVEKPMAQTLQEAEAVAAKARGSDRILMVGHLLEYHPGLGLLKNLIGSGELGDLYYLYSNRLNLGKLRTDENALWSLGAHDVSVALMLAQEAPVELHAFGQAYMQPEIEDVVFCYLRFPSGLAAHLHLSWLDPHKERRFTVVGSRKMATFDDTELEQKVMVYDKGFDQNFESYGEYMARSGDIWSPKVPNDEPLRLECRHFVECIATGTPPQTGCESGLRVVRVLEGLQRSLEATRGPETEGGHHDFNASSRRTTTDSPPHEPS